MDATTEHTQPQWHSSSTPESHQEAYDRGTIYQMCLIWHESNDWSSGTGI